MTPTGDPRIAIVGMGGVFPGVGGVEAFWQLVQRGESAVRTVPQGRWPVLPPPSTGAGSDVDTVASMRGFFVDHDQLPLADDVGDLDPTLRIAVAAAGRAIEDVEGGARSAERTGVIVGNIVLPTEHSSALAEHEALRALEESLFGASRREPLQVPDEVSAGLPAAFLARRFGFGGTAYTVDAACASSLYALELAGAELLSGRADTMITGGLSRPSSLYTHMGFTALKALAGNGICAPFDVTASGLVVGEGAAMFVIKRLDDALADGDRIYATVAGVGLSNDTAGSLLAPDSEGQLRAMRTAYAAAGWHPATVDLIECHATGTPLGDATEAESLRRLWSQQIRQPGRCVIGSVKSNVGHMLTAAGAAGLAKVLLAMRDHRLPPTATTVDPIPALAGSPFRLLSTSEHWPETAGRPRRAAVNAFGFGGINAHVLLEEWRTGEPVVRHRTVRAARDLAIVGRAARVGPWQSASAVDRSLLGLDDTAAHTWPAPERIGVPKWSPRGFFVDTLRVPMGRFRIPPNEFAAQLQQQLLALLAAADALDDAGWQPQWSTRTGVFVGVELDMQTGAFQQRWTIADHARRWNDEYQLGLDEAALAHWVGSLREAVAPELNSERTLGALAGLTASRIAREFRIGGPSFTVSAGDASGLKALAAAAHCLNAGVIDRAVVACVDLPAARVAAAAERAGTPCACPVSDGAVALVLRHLDDAVADGDDIVAVLGSDAGLQAPDGPDPATALGYCGAAAGLLRVYGGAMLLSRGLRAPTRPWLRDAADPPRAFAVTVGADRVILKEPPAPRPVMLRHCWAGAGAAELPLVFAADDRDELDAQLVDTANSDDTVAALAARSWRDRGRGGLRVGVAATDRAGLCSALAQARVLVGAGKSADGVVQRRRGVYFSTQPLLSGTQQGLAFVFPGSANHYPGMGRGLALAFPEILAAHEAENTRLRSQLHPELFWDDSDPAELAERCEELIFGQVSFSVLSVDALGAFGIRPAAVIGYSLGEAAALFGMRAWRDRDEMLERVRASGLFSRDLAGELRAVRQAWGMPDGGPAPRWLAGVVDRPAGVVSGALDGRARVYLLIVNTPNECVIGGDEGAVTDVVTELGAHFYPLPGVASVHCEVVAPVAAQYRQLHVRATEAPDGIRFYSGFAARSYVLDSEHAAAAILDQALHGVDFPATVARAHADGVRVFVEVGPGASGTRMIGDILRGKRFAAWTAANSARPEPESLLRAALGVYAEGHPVDFGPVFERAECAVTVSAARSFDVRRWHAPAAAPRPPRPVPAVSAGRAPSAPGQTALLTAYEDSVTAHLRAHRAYLALSGEVRDAMVEAVRLQCALTAADTSTVAPKVFMDRTACLEYAVGSIAAVLGPDFAEVDGYPTRVRLPDEPLMLVDRILEVDATPRSMTSGRVVTEHDVRSDAWYLDGMRMTTSVVVEAGQADLFLSGYLGVDLHTRGKAMYRLLDADIVFHRALPEPGDVIRYEITIDEFDRHDQTILFRFGFDAFVGSDPLLSMRNGCAGFFSSAELAAGRGVTRAQLAHPPQRGTAESGLIFAPMVPERYDDAAIAALRDGDLPGCFGPTFAGLPLRRARTIPGGEPGSLLRLLDRVTLVEPTGGRYGLGLIRAELDVRADDWFLVCHFTDDPVMPGTLMYECCLHTLRIFLLRMGWIGDEDDFHCEPRPESRSRLHCRGQVASGTERVEFEIEIAELGFEPYAYAVADALIFVDGKTIVEVVGMSLQFTGLRRQRLEQVWAGRRIDQRPAAALVGPEQILAYAVGNPSDAFGEPYRVFDAQRTLARLPGPPYLFLDRITAISGCRPFVLEAGGRVQAQYDVPADAWYFGGAESAAMPFAVLLEIALQPCGWFAAYLGSALTSPTDLRFRNLGGAARLHSAVHRDIGTLTVRVELTQVSRSGGMLIQHYDMAVFAGAEPVYEGDTYFGFFSQADLQGQTGIRGVNHYELSAQQRARSRSCPMAVPAGLCGAVLTAFDEVAEFVPDGGVAGLGFIRGRKRISAQDWVFAAHFHQDPVWPGSMGLQVFLQLLDILMRQRWGFAIAGPAPGSTHRWLYRGQVIPTDGEVLVDAWVTDVDEPGQTLTADGLLSVDGRVIYQITDFRVGR